LWRRISDIFLGSLFPVSVLGRMPGLRRLLAACMSHGGLEKATPVGPQLPFAPFLVLKINRIQGSD
jgi:hypothetical protein